MEAYLALCSPTMGNSLTIQYREKLQRRQFKHLRKITGAPWYIRNSNIHKYLKVFLVREEIKIANINYVSRITEYLTHLIRDLLAFEGHSHLKRVQTNNLADKIASDERV